MTLIKDVRSSRTMAALTLKSKTEILFVVYIRCMMHPVSKKRKVENTTFTSVLKRSIRSSFEYNHREVKRNATRSQYAKSHRSDQKLPVEEDILRMLVDTDSYLQLCMMWVTRRLEFNYLVNQTVGTCTTRTCGPRLRRINYPI